MLVVITPLSRTTPTNRVFSKTALVTYDKSIAIHSSANNKTINQKPLLLHQRG